MLATRCGGTDVQVEITGAPQASPGQQITFGVKAGDIRIFDASSGVTL